MSDITPDQKKEKRDSKEYYKKWYAENKEKLIARRKEKRAKRIVDMNYVKKHEEIMIQIDALKRQAKMYSADVRFHTAQQNKETPGVDEN